MREIELAPDRKRVVVTVYSDGKPVARDVVDLRKANARRKVAELCGETEETVLSWATALEGKTEPARYPCKDGGEDSRGPVVVRGIEQTRDSGIAHDASDPSRIVKFVMPTVPTDHVLEWKGQEGLCCLDIDYHGVPSPERDWLTTVMFTRLSPAPFSWHFSRGGGIHAFYIATRDFDADELAAVAALRFRTIDPTAGVELKSTVRGPGEEHVHIAEAQDTNGALSQWLGSGQFEEEDRDEWLESEGLVLGQRYDHNRCPISPSSDAGEKRKPVVVLDTGIKCFVCEGKGRALGSRAPGFASWGAILGTPASGDIGVLVRNIAHWGHAGWVIREKYGLPESIARKAYSAALKAYHLGDKGRVPLLPGVYHPDTANLARVNNSWLSIKASHLFPRDIQPIMARLPVCQHADADGKVVVSTSTVTALLQPMDLTDRGYPNIEVVHGFRLAARFLPPPARTVVAVPYEGVDPNRLPRYVLRSERMPEEDAWARIEQLVPKLDRKLVRLCLAACGCAQETKLGMHPMVFVTGTSGSAKTGTVRVAAGIIAGGIHDAVFTPDPDRFRENIRVGSQTGPIVMLNEILKDAGRGRNKLSAREALDPLLNLTPSSASWSPYRGPMKFGRLPVLVMTEPNLPASIRDETQIARRIRTWKLHGTKDWKESLANANVAYDQLHLLRNAGKDIARACDAVLSSVVDDFFAVPMTWDKIAEALGCMTLQDSQEYDDLTPHMRRFYALVCEAPSLEGRASELHGRGYKRISREDTTELRDVYTLFADGTGHDWLKSRRLTEKDWAGLLRTPQHVNLDMKDDGANLYVRFRVGPTRSMTAVNGEIVDPKTLEGL